MMCYDKPHKKLDCWRQSIALVTDIYLVTKTFPNEEKFGMVSQIRRCSISIAANIAEGAGRKSQKEFLNFLSISIGSISELDTLLIISNNIGYIIEERLSSLQQKLEAISKLTFGLANKIRETVVQ